MNNIYDKLNSSYRKVYKHDKFIPLHEPIFKGNEKKYLLDCIDSTFVSSVGKYVDEFQEKIKEFVSCKYAVATINGTSALHLALLSCDIGFDDEVICPDISFVATAAAITYTGASPIFLDIDETTLGLSPDKVEDFIIKNTYEKDGYRFNKITHKKIKACLPMHNIGFPVLINTLVELCKKYNILLIEDAAEALGSTIDGKMCGTFGDVGIYSFNGNKIITTGGGGMLVTDNEELYKKALHLSTTAKKNHPYKYIHDNIGYNYRMPNLNAALGVAQLELLPRVLEKKYEQGKLIEKNLSCNKLIDIIQSSYGISNRWFIVANLNGIKLDDFIMEMGKRNIMARPMWSQISKMDPYKKYYSSCNDISAKVIETYVCLPNGVYYE